MTHEDKRHSGTNDEFSNLTEAEKQQAEKDLIDLQSKTKAMIAKAKETASSLRKVADKLDKVWKDCKIAHASGTTASIVGGVLTIVGAVLAISLAGAATPVLMAGMALGVTGTGSNLGTSIVEALINSSEIKKLDKNLQESLACMNRVKNTVQSWLKNMPREKLSFIFYLAARNLEFSDPVVNILHMASSTLGSSGFIVEVIEKIALQAGKGGVQAASDVAESGAKAGAKGGSKIAGRVIIGVSATFLVFDVIDLGFTIKDIVQKEGSKAARFLRKKADELEKVC